MPAEKCRQQYKQDDEQTGGGCEAAEHPIPGPADLGEFDAAGCLFDAIDRGWGSGMGMVTHNGNRGMHGLMVDWRDARILRCARFRLDPLGRIRVSQCHGSSRSMKWGGGSPRVRRRGDPPLGGG